MPNPATPVTASSPDPILPSISLGALTLFVPSVCVLWGPRIRLTHDVSEDLHSLHCQASAQGGGNVPIT
jgi:hypothetical protein